MAPSDGGIGVDCWVVDLLTRNSGLVFEVSGDQAYVSFGRRSQEDGWIPLCDLEIATEAEW